MRERLRRWSEDETVGKALMAAGLVFLVVQWMPPSVFALVKRMWPLAIIAVGAMLLWRRPVR